MKGYPMLALNPLPATARRQTDTNPEEYHPNIGEACLSVRIPNVDSRRNKGHGDQPSNGDGAKDGWPTHVILDKVEREATP
mmetsp:Transcript_26137/g.41361  ORF Transcript_26137/g.41361 Transcript_26137/m.41361 type:complete len:81 (-) Transcript_26137:621-863(-)